ncbi:MAG: DUF4160 domain-containing protein [Acidobacteriota bacterium]
MPTVKDIAGPYRFYFYSFDCNERPHVHVSAGPRRLQILARSSGVSAEPRIRGSGT